MSLVADYKFLNDGLDAGGLYDLTETGTLTRQVGPTNYANNAFSGFTSTKRLSRANAEAAFWPGTGSHSVVFWIKTTTTASWQSIYRMYYTVSVGDETWEQYYYIHCDTTTQKTVALKMKYYYYNFDTDEEIDYDDDVYNYATKITNGVWSMYTTVWTRGASGIKIFKNKTLATSATSNFSAGFDQTKTGQTLLIGVKTAGSTSDCLTGNLGPMKIYNHALTQGEVNQIYDAQVNTFPFLMAANT